MKIKNVSGQPRQIAATGQEVDAGGITDVRKEFAGRPPKGDPGDDNYDPGEGLLAQPDNWQPVASKASKDTEGDD